MGEDMGLRQRELAFNISMRAFGVGVSGQSAAANMIAIIEQTPMMAGS
jgi:hypothetical protein